MFSGPLGVASLQPISREGKLPPLFTPATIWSIDASSAELFATLPPVVEAAEPIGWGDALPIMFLSPLTTVNQGLTGMSGASSSVRAQADPVPVADGFQSAGMIPFPKNQVQYRLGSGAPCAKAVPLLFSMMSRIGRGTDTAAPVARAPRRTVRRLKRFVGILILLA